MGRSPPPPACRHTLITGIPAWSQVTAVTDRHRGVCNTACMNIVRAVLLVVTALLIPGGLILLIPLVLREYRSLIQARRNARQRSPAQLALENGEIEA